MRQQAADVTVGSMSVAARNEATVLVRNFGLRPVAAISQLVMPDTLGILVLDAVRGAGDLLFGRGNLGGAQRVLVRGECFREGRADQLHHERRG